MSVTYSLDLDNIFLHLTFLHVSVHISNNLGVCHAQYKNYKKLEKHKVSKSTSNTKDRKPF